MESGKDTELSLRLAEVQVTAHTPAENVCTHRTRLNRKMAVEDISTSISSFVLFFPLSLKERGFSSVTKLSSCFVREPTLISPLQVSNSTVNLAASVFPVCGFRLFTSTPTLTL